MRLIAILVFSAIAFKEAMACSCLSHDGTLEESVLDSYEKASAVVLAKAEHIEKLNSLFGEVWSEGKGSRKEEYYTTQRTQFVAIKSWKGGHAKRFFTEIQILCCLCGYRFEEGENYLLYLYGPDKNGYFGTSSCSRTKRESKNLKKEIEILDKIGLVKSSKETPKSGTL